MFYHSKDLSSDLKKTKNYRIWHHLHFLSLYTRKKNWHFDYAYRSKDPISGFCHHGHFPPRRCRDLGVRHVTWTCILGMFNKWGHLVNSDTCFPHLQPAGSYHWAKKYQANVKKCLQIQPYVFSIPWIDSKLHTNFLFFSTRHQFLFSCFSFLLSLTAKEIGKKKWVSNLKYEKQLSTIVIQTRNSGTPFLFTIMFDMRIQS